MTAHEYRKALAHLGLSQLAAARLLGVNPRTSRRWALGEQNVSETASRFLSFLIACECSGEQAMAILKL
ncbi:MAG: hypothetical protein J2P54_00300 [Bradyrhizobiaceae bacterium]|nr:hypothetical protein [Bradyrhizobiaceae bacterium]